MRILPNIIIISMALCAMTILAGCGMFFGGDDGLGDATVHDLDGLFDKSILVEEGEAFVLEMAHPGHSGYDFKGAVFDPSFLRLDKYLEIPDEDVPETIARVQYLFSTLKPGSTDIAIKVHKPLDSDYPVEVFKSVHLVIEED